MEYEIEEEDLLFDHATSNPSLHPPGGAQVGEAPRRRREFRIPEEQMG